MEAKLVVVGGEAEAAEIRLQLPTIIGRGRDASLTLPHPLVSRQHCEIFESAGRLYVRDLGSLNGTYVNNQRIEGDRELPANQLLTIGAVTFRAVYESEASQDEAPEQSGPPAEQLADQADDQSARYKAATVQIGNGNVDTNAEQTLNACEDETGELGQELDSQVGGIIKE